MRRGSGRRCNALASAAWLLVAPGCGADSAPAERAASATVPEAGPGRWKEFRTHRHDPGLSPEQREEIRRLEAIGYASGSRDAGDERGVTRHDPERAFAGANFIVSGHGPEALLTDMKGEVLHRWRFGFRKAWPDYPVEDELPMTAFWRRAHLFPNGELLAIFEGLGLIKLDRDSNLLWKIPVRAHHDLQVAPDGSFYALTREAHLVPRVNEDEPVLEDFISRFDAGGRELERVSMLEALERSEFASLWRESGIRKGDLFHTNSLEILDGRAAAKHPAFAAGRALVSILTLDAIAVVDLGAKRVVWLRTGDFREQHDPEILDDGNLLLFDNRGIKRESRVLEIDPASFETRWLYRGTDAEPFYSKRCGTAQRLPNGNTLVTESDNGRAFEVTPGGAIVWEFYNPHRAGEGDRFIATLFEVVRLAPEFPLDWVRPATHARNPDGHFTR